MVTAKRQVAGSALTTSLATYYTVPTATTGVIKELILCNTDTTVATVTAYMVPAGMAASSIGVAQTILSATSIQAAETKIFGLSEVLTAGMTFQALASVAAKVSVTASGVEIT